MNENEISKVVFESGLKIHRKLGVGVYEAVYEECLVYELNKNGLKVEKQKDIPIEYGLNQVSKDLIGKPVNAGAVPPL